MTLTEFNQNPSRVVRLLERDATTVIRVTKRGRPLFQVTAIPPVGDPLQGLVAAGLAEPPANPSQVPIAYDDQPVPPWLDLDAELTSDRARRDV